VSAAPASAQPGAVAAAPPAGDKLKPIHPARAGTYTSGKWHFQLQINAAGTRGEGRWGWLTYDGQKLPRGNINDYYETPWGPMYWVDVPQSSAGLHGFMPITAPQNPRRGRELTLPASLLASDKSPTAPSTPAAAAAPPPAPKVQTLEINRSHNGQLARLHAGNVLIIRLSGNPNSGYQWQAGTSNTKALRLTVRPQYSPSAAGAATGTYTFTYEAVQPGSGYLRLYYVRPGDPSHPRDAFAIGVNVSPASSQSARAARGSVESR
jgi:predicted secreted protein